MTLKLESPDTECYRKLASWIRTPDELMQFAGAGFSFPLTEAQLRSSAEDENIIPFKVSDSTGAPVGYAEIHIREQSAFLCRIILGDEQVRGKGNGTQLIRLLLGYITNNIRHALIELNVYEFNKGAIRCYEKAGFTINPSIKTVREFNGRNWTSLRMQLQPGNQNL